MNDEIKEILEEIDNKIIPNEHWNKIKDYITNLQEENERLKNREKEAVEHYNTAIKYSHEIEDKYIDYKSRCEKAIEFIENFKYGMPYTEWVKKEELLNILNGGDDK